MKNYNNLENKIRQVWRKSLFVLLSSVFILFNLALLNTPLNAYAASGDSVKIEGFNDYVDVQQCNYSLTGTPGKDTTVDTTIDGTKKTFSCITLQHQSFAGNDFSYVYSNENLNEFDYYVWEESNPIASGLENVYYDNNSLIEGTYNGNKVFNLADGKYLSSFKNYMVYKVMKFVPEWSTSIDGKQKYKFSSNGNGEIYYETNSPYTSYYRYNANGQLEIVYNKYAELGSGKVEYLATNNYEFGNSNSNNYNTQYHTITNLHNSEFKLQQYSQTFVTVDANGNKVGSPNFSSSSYVKNDNGVINFYIWDSSAKKFYIYNVNIVEDNNWVSGPDLKTIVENGNQTIVQRLENELISKTKEYRSFYETTYKLVETTETKTGETQRFVITEEKYIPSQTGWNSYVSFDVNQKPLNYDMAYEYKYKYLSDTKYDYTVNYKQQQYEYTILDQEKIDSYKSTKTYDLVKKGEVYENNSSSNGGTLLNNIKQLPNSEGVLYYTKNPLGHWNWKFTINGLAWSLDENATNRFFSTSSVGGLNNILVSDGTGKPITFNGENKPVVINGAQRTIYNSDNGWYYYDGASYNKRLHKMSGYEIAVTHTSKVTPLSKNPDLYDVKDGIDYNTIKNSTNGQQHTYYTNRQREEINKTVYDITYKYAVANKFSQITYEYEINGDPNDYNKPSEYENSLYKKIENTKVGETFRVFNQKETGYRQKGYHFNPYIRKYVTWTDGWFSDDYFYFIQLCFSDGTCSNDHFYLIGQDNSVKNPNGFPHWSFPDLKDATKHTKYNSTNLPGKHGEYKKGVNGVASSGVYKLVSSENSPYSTIDYWDCGFKEDNRWVTTTQKESDNRKDTTVYDYVMTADKSRAEYQYRYTYDEYTVETASISNSDVSYAEGSYQKFGDKNVYIVSCKSKTVLDHYEYKWTENILTVSKKDLPLTLTGYYDIKVGNDYLLYNNSNDYKQKFTSEGDLINHLKNPYNGKGNSRGSGYNFEYSSGVGNIVSSNYNIYVYNYSFDNSNVYQYKKVKEQSFSNGKDYTKLRPIDVAGAIKKDFGTLVSDVTCNGTKCSVTPAGNITNQTIELYTQGNEYMRYQDYVTHLKENILDSKQTTGSWNNIAQRSGLYNERVTNLTQNQTAPKMQNDSGFYHNGNNGLTDVNVTSTYVRTYQTRETKTVFNFEGFKDTNNVVSLHILSSLIDYNQYTYSGDLNKLNGPKTTLTPCSSSSNGICYRPLSMSKVVSEQTEEIRKVEKVYVQKENVDYSKTSDNVAHYTKNLPDGTRLCKDKFDNNCAVLVSASGKATHSTHEYTKTIKTYSKQLVANNTAINYNNKTNNSNINKYYDLGTLKGAQYHKNGFSGGSVVDRKGYNTLTSHNRFDQYSWFLNNPNGSLSKYMNQNKFVFKGTGNNSTVSLENIEHGKTYYVGFNALGSGTIKVTVNGVSKTFTINQTDTTYKMSFVANGTTVSMSIEFNNANVEMYNIYASNQDKYTEFASYNKGNVTNIFYESNSYRTSAKWYDTVAGENENNPLITKSRVIGYDATYFTNSNIDENERNAIKYIIDLAEKKQFNIAKVVYFIDLNHDGKVDVNRELYKQDNYINKCLDDSCMKYRYVLTGVNTKDLTYETSRKVTISFSNNNIFGTKVEKVTSDGNNENGYNISMDFDSGKNVINWNQNVNGNLPVEQMACKYGNCYSINSVQGKYILADEFLTSLVAQERAKYAVNEYGVVVRKSDSDTTNYARYNYERDVHKKIGADGKVYRLDSGFREQIILKDEGTNFENYKDLVLASGLKLGVNTDIESSIVGVNSSNYTLSQETLKEIYDKNATNKALGISKDDIRLENGKYILNKKPTISINITGSNLFEGNTHLGIIISNEASGTYNEYFTTGGNYYRIIKDENNKTGFTRYKQFYINGKWTSYDLLADKQNVITKADLNISSEFTKISKFNEHNIHTYLYNGHYLIENIVLNVYYNPNGTTRNDKYSNVETDKYFYKYEIEGEASNKYSIVKTYRLYELQDIFNKENSIPQTNIKVNTNLITTNGITLNIKNKFIFKNQSYNVYNIKAKTTDLFVKNVIKLSDLSVDGSGTNFLDYSTVDMNTIQNNKTYGLKFSGMLNYWGNTINGAKVVENNTIDTTKIKQKESYINFDGEKVPEFILNATGNNNFELYGLSQVSDNGNYYRIEDIIDDAFRVLNGYVMNRNNNYLMRNDRYTTVWNEDYKTSGLINWEKEVEKYNGFYEMFANSSLLNVAYYVDNSYGEARHYVRQYDVNKKDSEPTKAIIDKFGFIMNLYMVGAGDGNANIFDSVFDRRKQFLNIVNEDVYSVVTDKNDNNNNTDYGGQANGGFTSYWTKNEMYYDFYNNIVSKMVELETGTNKELTKEDNKSTTWKYVTNQVIGQLFDNYLFLDTYSYTNNRTYNDVVKKMVISGFSNLMQEIVNEKSSDYIFVNSDKINGRYYIYKKLSRPEIIRNANNNYNIYNFQNSSRIESLSQYFVSKFGESLFANKTIGVKLETALMKTDNEFWNGYFDITNIGDYFNINGKAKNIYTVLKPEASNKKEIDFSNISITGKIKYKVHGASYNGACHYIFDDKTKSFIMDETYGNSDTGCSPGGPFYLNGNYVEDILAVGLTRKDMAGTEENKFELSEKEFYKYFSGAHLKTTHLLYKGVKVSSTINGVNFNIPLFNQLLNYDLKTNKLVLNEDFDVFNLPAMISDVILEYEMGESTITGVKLTGDTIGNPASINFLVGNTIGTKIINNNATVNSSFNVTKNIENDTDYTNIRTNFSVSIKPTTSSIYNYILSYNSNSNACGEGFVYKTGKCYYQSENLSATDKYGTIYNIENPSWNSEVVIRNLPQKTKFDLSIGIRNADGSYIEKYVDNFETGDDMVRNPYGTTLNKGTDYNGIYCENGVCDADKMLEQQYIPYGLKEWLFEKQTNTLPETVSKQIGGKTYNISSKYLSKLSKNNTIKIGFVLVDNENNIFKPKTDFNLKFVEGVETGQNDKYHIGLDGESNVKVGKDGVFYFELNENEKLLLKNKYNENYTQFVNDYIFKNYIIEVDYKSGKYGNMSLQTPYKLMAMSCHDEMWSYLDYNQNGSMDKTLDATKQYYDRNGEILYSEDVSSDVADVTVGLDFGIENVNTMWHQSQISNVREFKLFRFYTGTTYKYYIMGYNRNNSSNIIK